MQRPRRKSRVVKIGQVRIGGNFPVAIQSMTKTKTSDEDRTIRQIKKLEAAGCDIVRVAVKDSADARAIRQIKKNTRLPLVADIHFDYRLALEAIESGVDKIRLNPGNIYKDSEIKEVITALKRAGRPLRIGVNSGSVPKAHGKKRGMADRLAASCVAYVRKVERLKFYDIVISLKASTVWDTIEAYRKVAKVCEYPMHLGVTATGTPRQGAIKSAIACGMLLAEGIGDTIRISLTDEPQEEVRVARDILSALELGNFGPEIISCPTCGRCEVDLVSIVKDLESRFSTAHRQPSTNPLKVAIMGCVVNGPGEAKEADIGVAFGKNEGLLFTHGKAVRKIPYADCARIIMRRMKKKND